MYSRPSSCHPNSEAGTEFPAPRPDQRLVTVEEAGTGPSRLEPVWAKLEKEGGVRDSLALSLRA